jgi:hypothetical protein
MDKLNWTYEQVDDVANSGDCKDQDFQELSDDWLTLHAENERLDIVAKAADKAFGQIQQLAIRQGKELTRLHTAIDGAREEIEKNTEQWEELKGLPKNDLIMGFISGVNHALDILRKYLGDEK